MTNPTTQLTDAQREAAKHLQGPLLILAGPGSGKTRVVTHRIANLLDAGVPSRKILALTFTNKAADEMRHRVEALAPSSHVWISTFHRFCARLLREYAPLVGLRENFTIYDMSDSERALRLAIESLPEVNVDKIPPSRLLRQISECKNNLIGADTYQAESRSALAVVLQEVYPAYQAQLLRANAVDFDDLLMHCVHLLRTNVELRRDLDARYQYIMVDEYQDTNLAQYAIARALSVDHPHLAVTGDPDQSIYGWRGANIQNILGFEQDYPQVKVVRLEENFRSTPQILNVADQLIQFNQRRKAKSLIPVRDLLEPVTLCAFPSQLDEARYLADEIQTMVKQGGRSYKDFAIFYRINALSRYLEHTLQEAQIPYQVLNGVEFYQRKEVKDVLAYLQLVNNPTDDVAFTRIINVPPRGLGKVALGHIVDTARQLRLPLLEAAQQAQAKLTRRASKSLGAFLAMMERLQGLATATVEEILGHLLSLSAYEDHVLEQDQRADEDRGANIRELLSAARQFDMLHTGPGYLEAFLEQTSLVSDTDAWEAESDKVTLMTLHGSKGLEFPVVYLVAVEQGKLPHERSLEDPEQLEEERRLMFVGLTRAQDKLTISYAKYRDYRGRLAPTVPSSFLMELPRDTMRVVLPDDASHYEDYPESWDDVEDADTDFAPETFAQEAASPPDPPATDLLSSLTTAAAMEATTPPASSPARVDPNLFTQGMRVTHPEFGLGKITALTGEGKGRTATVQFVTSGEETFQLYFSPLKPV